MRQDRAPPGGRAGKFRQAAAFGEGAHADHRVVAPEVAVVARPGGDAASDGRAIDPARELDHAGKQGLAAHQHRQGLDQGKRGIGAHPRAHLSHDVAADDAVGVQHHHLVVAPAPPAHEFRDVARLAARVVGPPAVPDGQGAGVAQRGDGQRLGREEIRVAAVGQDEDLGPVGHPGLGQLVGQGAQHPHAVGWVLVIDRHHDRHAGSPRIGGRHGRAGDQPRDQRAEAEADPAEGEGEEDQQRPLQRLDAVAEDDQHLPEADGRDQGRAPEGDQPGGQHPCRGGFARRAGGRSRTEVLRGHGQRHLGRDRRDAAQPAGIGRRTLRRTAGKGAGRAVPAGQQRWIGPFQPIIPLSSGTSRSRSAGRRPGFPAGR